MAVLGVAAVGRWFVWPASAVVSQAHAVVLFAGGRGERLERALGLMDTGVAPVLVISNGMTPEWDDANRLCKRPPERYEVRCPTPDPDTTKGEAVMTARLAEREGWDRLVLVTSTYHARRAGMLLGRCHEGSVSVVAARPRQSWLRSWQLATAEAAATARAWLDSGC